MKKHHAPEPSLAQRISEHLESVLLKWNKTAERHGKSTRYDWNRRNGSLVAIEKSDWGRRFESIQIYRIDDEDIDANLDNEYGIVGKLLGEIEVTPEGDEHRSVNPTEIAITALALFENDAE